MKAKKYLVLILAALMILASCKAEPESALNNGPTKMTGSDYTVNQKTINRVEDAKYHAATEAIASSKAMVIENNSNTMLMGPIVYTFDEPTEINSSYYIRCNPLKGKDVFWVLEGTISFLPVFDSNSRAKDIDDYIKIVSLSIVVADDAAGTNRKEVVYSPDVDGKELMNIGGVTYDISAMKAMEDKVDIVEDIIEILMEDESIELENGEKRSLNDLLDIMFFSDKKSQEINTVHATDDMDLFFHAKGSFEIKQLDDGGFSITLAIAGGYEAEDDGIVYNDYYDIEVTHTFNSALELLSIDVHTAEIDDMDIWPEFFLDEVEIEYDFYS